MSHRVHPYAHRLGIIKDWKSRWFGVGAQYKKYLKSDITIREYLEKKLRGMYMAGIEIERGQKTLRIIIESSRPGAIIGRNGEGMIKLRADLLSMLERKGLPIKEEMKIDIKEIRYPEANAAIVGQMVSEGLEKRMPFRRVMKQMVEKVMANREVLGVKIELSGRLGGAEMSRTEKLKKGRVPLQTLRADVDFCKYEAYLPYGKIGIKTWIYKGDIFAKDVNKA
ncbi:30S ribosomal protein S3 [Candidatus Parcubacteria bacterium]|nr:30S ribosomal protein S3 [Candidatus Parcubacteria bacterium]